ncbi:integral membrane protein, YjbE family [Faunimonas pinastri]|uniref:Integral membrane protein, YjbE family n=1 Tax=Faunimonas pinastri TaxID=1855383 RepID=A0A1H9P9L0_9HYPH|nr:YjbE family putative metal transport protein [Faunimonas pinastri]SER44888.1 integral membrane protein, YjbE family [Faunimonas pinastri]
MTGAPLVTDLFALVQVIFLDLVLAGDNAVVVGLAVAGLPGDTRRKIVVAGIALAVMLRIGLALVAAKLLTIVGVGFAGGLLLLWVCWKLLREVLASGGSGGGETESAAKPKSGGQALMQIVMADLSMSLDNVLAVAGAAREHPTILAAGLAVSVVLMGGAATVIARVLDRWRWLSWAGILIVFVVALRMIWTGGVEIGDAMDWI